MRSFKARYFLTRMMTLQTEIKKFFNPTIKKVLKTINSMFHQLFEGVLEARYIYPELKKGFSKGHSNVTWKNFLITKVELWVDIRYSTDKTLHRSSRIIEKEAFYFKLKKQLKAVMVTLISFCSVLKM